MVMHAQELVFDGDAGTTVPVRATAPREPRLKTREAAITARKSQ
jgi:hypothetical protein